MIPKSPLSWIELSQKALNQNIRSLSKLAKGTTLAVSVKANAYGHGLAEIASMLQQQPGVEYLTVHSIEEAIASRQAGFDRKIMILGPVAKEAIEAIVEHDLEPVIFELSFLTALGKYCTKIKYPVRTHLKLETGTNRQGVTAVDLPAFAKVYQKYPALGKPWGAGMHFANIEDTTNHEYAEFQLKNFKSLVTLMGKFGIKPKVRHTASSAALILFDKTHFELARPGISAYGHWPSKETYLSYRLKGGDNDLFAPVLSWKTQITQLKKIPADSFIGYGCSYRTTSPTRLAVLPVGYYDGYSRALSNSAYVLIRGKRAPVRGRVCMNLMMVDITDIKGVRLGDEVTLIGCDGPENVTAEQLAQWSDTINYEILARLSPLLPRVVV